jgi:hypothetical protein
MTWNRNRPVAVYALFDDDEVNALLVEQGCDLGEMSSDLAIRERWVMTSLSPERE